MSEAGRFAFMRANGGRRTAKVVSSISSTIQWTSRRRREVVIASCGGYPHDINLIQAHKSLDMAAHACTDGGTIVLLAECRDGLGRPDFLKWFEEKDSRALEARLRDAYEVNGQTAWSLLTKAERYRIHLVSELPDEDVRRMRMIPARSCWMMPWIKSVANRKPTSCRMALASYHDSPIVSSPGKQQDLHRLGIYFSLTGYISLPLEMISCTRSTITAVAVITVASKGDGCL